MKRAALDALQIPDKQLADFCRRHEVKQLSAFGSVLGDEFGPESDIDLLVEFLPSAQPTLFDLGGMLMELREMLGREVDLRTPADLSPYFRDEVVATAQLLYAA